jgi:hypothetical protein
MKPIPFNTDTDIAPFPFDEKVIQAARQLKQLGLPWQPHVGCFVWDPDGTIEAESPFPGRVYFILSLPRFIAIFGSVEAMREKLVWLPTWHQARLLCRRMGIKDEEVAALWRSGRCRNPGDEALLLYEKLAETLNK